MGCVEDRPIARVVSLANNIFRGRLFTSTDHTPGKLQSEDTTRAAIIERQNDMLETTAQELAKVSKERDEYKAALKEAIHEIDLRNSKLIQIDRYLRQNYNLKINY